MPTFEFSNSAASNSAVFLLDIPDIAWFKDSITQALAEMVEPDNWLGTDEDYRVYAINQASRMLATYKVLNFNPFPVGLILPFAASVAPPGYLPCDGSSQSVTNFPELFAVIGYTYGGSGANFSLPNLINRVPVGSGDSFTFNTSGGQETVTLGVSEMPSHSHTDLGHNHTIPTTIALPAQAGVGFAGLTAVPLIPSFTGTSSANLLNTGGDSPHENMPPYLAVPYIIYAGR